MRQIDPDLPLNEIRTMEARLDSTLASRRSPALLAGIFAGVALLLAAVGTHGVLAYAASQQQREIGVRMALGAQPRQVLTQFLVLGGKLFVAGLSLGVLGGWGTGYAMQGMLFGVGPPPPAIFAITAAVMAVVVVAAMLLPAWRAASISPMAALRSE